MSSELEKGQAYISRYRLNASLSRDGRYVPMARDLEIVLHNNSDADAKREAIANLVALHSVRGDYDRINGLGPYIFKSEAELRAVLKREAEKMQIDNIVEEVLIVYRPVEFVLRPEQPQVECQVFVVIGDELAELEPLRDIGIVGFPEADKSMDAHLQPYNVDGCYTDFPEGGKWGGVVLASGYASAERGGALIMAKNENEVIWQAENNELPLEWMHRVYSTRRDLLGTPEYVSCTGLVLEGIYRQLSELKHEDRLKLLDELFYGLSTEQQRRFLEEKSAGQVAGDAPATS